MAEQAIFLRDDDGPDGLGEPKEGDSGGKLTDYGTTCGQQGVGLPNHVRFFTEPLAKENGFEGGGTSIEPRLRRIPLSGG